ncbi:hypothetical protein [Streptomyces sp. NBC_00334]|uniref:hypothetical protein n=1 Tax=Streptomyces sp. NBC_00334 TaxID=2975713 RepID=UPI002E2A214C|nr:hypothetical protein [Streptomyces sp. NBC_00334]
MIAEALDTLITLGWVLAAWVAVFAAIGTAVLMGVTAAFWWSCRALWRLARSARIYRTWRTP